VAEEAEFDYSKGNAKAMNYGVETRALGVIEAGNGHFFNAKAFLSSLD